MNGLLGYMFDAARFYDGLARDYHLIFGDWRGSVIRQGKILDRIIRVQTKKRARSVLDCSCGIGTQAIGLALRGYNVRGTDLSRAAVRRARREAKSFGLSIRFGVADFRALESQVAGVFDVVVSCDNSLPHLLRTKDLGLAVRSMHAKLRMGGLLLITMRDYDQIAKERPRVTPISVIDNPKGRRISFQVWDWTKNGRTYVLHHFILQEGRGSWQVAHRVAEYRALLREETSKLLRKAGFTDIRWQMPSETGYYQPLVTARKGH